MSLSTRLVASQYVVFVEAILEYLYVAPAKIRAVQERLGRLNTARKVE